LLEKSVKVENKIIQLEAPKNVAGEHATSFKATTSVQL
jgi:hypothetical protein